MKKMWTTNKKALKAGMFAVTLLAVVLLTMTQVFAEVHLNLGTENKVYTNSLISASIDLSGVNEENTVFFTKNPDNTYSYSSYKDLNTGAANLVIEGTWTADEPKVFYIAFTDYTKDDLDYLTDVSGTAIDSNTISLDLGPDTLILHKITVFYDHEIPVIDSVISSYPNQTHTTLTVNAHDMPSSPEENASGIAVYSFDGGASWQPSNSKTFTSNGNVNIYVRDAAGNVSEVEHAVVQLDTTGPTFNASVVPDLSNGSAPWQLSATVTINNAADSQSGLASSAYSFDNGSSWETLTSKTITTSGDVVIRVKDAVGNYTSHTVSPKIDDFPPVFDSITMTNNVTATGSWAQLTTITINGASDEDRSGLAAAPYSFDGGAHWQLGNSKMFQSKGAVSICVKDALGNETTPQIFELNQIDTTAPHIDGVNVTLIDPHDGWARSATFEVLNASDDESGLATNPYSVDDGAHWQSENTFTITQNGDYTVLVRDAVGNIHESDVLHVDHIDTAAPAIAIDESTISSIWATGTATVELNVTDDAGIDTITGEIDNGTVTPIVQKTGTPGVYIATITGDANAVVEKPIKFTAKDILDNENTGVFSTKNILIDNTDPVLSIDESSISADWKASSATFEFTASDTGSGVNMISGSVTNGHVTIAGKPGFLGTYIATVTANSGFDANDQVYLTVTDNVNHSVTSHTNKAVKADAKDATLSELFVQKTSGSGNPNVVKDGDTVKVSFKVTDTGSGVKPDSVVVTLNGVSKAAGHTGDDYTCTFTAGADFTAADDSFLRINQIAYADNVGNSMITAQNTDTAIRYYSAITTGFSDLKFWSSNADPTIAKNGDTVFVSFLTTHPVNIESGTISQSASTHITWLKQNDTTKKSGSYYTEGSYTVVNDTAFDMQSLKLALTIGDAAENSALSKTQANASNILYYAPLSVSGVTVTSNNTQDATQFAKNGDTVTVTFATNHDVTVSASAIAGKAVTSAKTDGSGLVKNWSMAYTIAGGDLSDLAVVPFAFTISDKAGNTPISVNNGTAGVLHSLRYYAPLTATTSIASNYKNSNYAKNTDTVTVTAKTNHAATIVSSAICGRKAANVGSGGINLKMSYQIPSGENSIAEGAVGLSYTVTDAAGNTLTVNKTSDAASSVTYDRTNPTVSVDPSSLSFSASAVTYSVTFEDEHLTGADISVKVNGEEQMTSRDRSSVSGNRYTKSVTLGTDGNYKLVASLLDSAGNASNPDAATSVTVDTTKPEIKAVKLDTSTPKAFKAGFMVRDYFEFVDQNIRDIICTVSDNEGTRDWDINEPLTGDGKKTINLIVTDMADNSSTSITYDLYIDGTAPKPVITDSQSQTAVSADQPATFISEMTLSIGLEALNTGDIASADHFTKIELLKDDQKFADVLNTVKPDENGVYSYPLTSFGKYTLLLAAADDVGNETGDLEYHFIFNDKSIFQKFFENTPLFVTVMSILVIGLATLITLKIVRRNRKSNTANSI